MTTTTLDYGTQLDDLRVMFAWLAERPDLPLPLHGAWAMPAHGARWGEDGDALHVFARTPAEFDRLAVQFDQYEPAPPYPQHPWGIRRLFGSVAYELLLDESQRGDQRPEPARSERLTGLVELVAWLGERPGLLAPTFGLGARLCAGDTGADDRMVFTIATESAVERDAVVALFDRVERWPGQPDYAESRSRLFAGGIGLEVRD